MQNCASGNSSRCSTPNAQVTKVTATAKFKVEVHAPSTPGSSSPIEQTGHSGHLGASPYNSGPRRSRRTRKSSSTKNDIQKETASAATAFPSATPDAGSIQSNLSDSLRSSLTNSVSSSLSSNDGDLGFSEK